MLPKSYVKIITPIADPLFSNIWTHLYFWPSSRLSSIQQSMTLTNSSTDIKGTDMFDFGLKHMTLQVPLAGSDLKSENSSSGIGGSGTSSNKAGKSFVNTYVDL